MSGLSLKNLNQKNSSYRGRFAPSPTGDLHLGTARTALIAWMRARKAGGEFLLRIEDIDLPRVVPGSEDGIKYDLEWLGLDWDDETPRQSARFEPYEAAIDQLRGRSLDAKLFVFPCSCSRKDIALASSAPHADAAQRSPDGTIYPGTCRQGPTQPERPLTVRFRFDGQRPFRDGFCGEISGFDDGDFVIKRSDGLYAYQLAVVVDDLDQGITEVVRGDDLLSSTPRQIALFEALGKEAPNYFHVPLMNGPDGIRLSKRHGSVSIHELRNGGKSPEEVIAVLANSLLKDGDERLKPLRAKELLACWRESSALLQP